MIISSLRSHSSIVPHPPDHHITLQWNVISAPQPEEVPVPIHRGIIFCVMKVLIFDREEFKPKRGIETSKSHSAALLIDTQQT